MRVNSHFKFLGKWTSKFRQNQKHYVKNRLYFTEGRNNRLFFKIGYVYIERFAFLDRMIV